MEFLGVQKLLSEKQMKFPSKGKKPGASLAKEATGPVGYQGLISDP